MADITQEYATDPTTGQTVAVDPPLPASETPLMGNSVLTRRAAPRKGGSNTALYAGAGLALVAILAGGAYLIASGVHHRSDLTTAAETAPPLAEQAAATPAPAPIVSPTPTPAAPVVASAETPEQPLRPARAERAVARATRHAEHRAAARAAGESGADASATVPSRQFAPVPAAAPPAPPAASAPVTSSPATSSPATSAPATSAPSSATAGAAPVITPPPAAQ